MSGQKPTPDEGQRAEEAPQGEPIATILARAETNNPLPHISGPRGLGLLGPGRRSGRLTRGAHKKERLRANPLFGIEAEPGSG